MIEEYKYDRNGNLRFVLDPNKAAVDSFIYYKYDALNRKVSEGVVAGTSNFTQSNANNVDYPTSNYRELYQYEYDLGTNGKGRLYFEAESPYSSSYNLRMYSYDEEGRISDILIRVPSIGDKNISYTYDLQGNVTEIEYPD